MQQQIQRQGIIYALCAYTLWGLAPIYFKTISAVPAAEILTHRMIWSCALLMVLTLIGRQWHKVQVVLRQPKVLLTLAFTSITVGGNWLLFIWAINNGHMLDASLGYYINPLFNVLLGALAVLLWRHSGQQDLCIGTPFANRNRAEIEPLIGHFVNTLVLRHQLDWQRSFSEQLSHSREMVLNAF